MDKDESIAWACIPGDYTGNLLFFYENGKVSRVPLRAYQTLTKQKKLANAYSDKSPVHTIMFLPDGTEHELVLFSTEDRALIFNTEKIPLKMTRSTQGVQVMTLRKAKHHVKTAKPLSETTIVNTSRYKPKNIPAAGALLKAEDQGDTQIGFEI